MKYYIMMAWRNVWRNKRRTIILSASIMFGVFSAIIMVGFQTGFYGKVVENITQSYLGDIQIHANGYWDEKIIDNTFDLQSNLIRELNNDENIRSFTARLESFALASSGQQTKGTLIIGTEIDKEVSASRLDEKIVKGRVLVENDGGVMLSQGLARYLQVDINDTIVFLGQGYHGVSAAGKFPVRAIFHLPSPDLDNQVVYMNLSTAQVFYSTGNHVSSLVINLKKPQQVDKIKKDMMAKLDTANYEIMAWSQIAPELDSLIKSEIQNTYILVGILYLIIGFGIFGTVLMMTTERKREFGVVVAIGMRKTSLIKLMTLEIIFMGFIGIIAGVLVSLPIVYYFHVNPYEIGGEMGEFIKGYGFEPLLPLAWSADYIVDQCMVVVYFIVISAFHPIYQILRLEVIKALRK